MTYDRHRNIGITPCISTISGKCIRVKGSFAIRVNQYPVHIHIYVSQFDRQANTSRLTEFNNTSVQRFMLVILREVI